MSLGSKLSGTRAHTEHSWHNCAVWDQCLGEETLRVKVFEICIGQTRLNF